MANYFVADFETQSLTGWTATTGPGAFSFPINYNPSLGTANPTRCLKIHGGQSGFGQTGICMTTALPNSPSGYVIFFQFAIDGGQAVISLENADTLWSTDVNKVQIHYNQAGPAADLYSGINNTYPDALNSNEWIDHMLEITPTGAILGRHRHFTTPGILQPFSSSLAWSTGSWGLTNVAQHQNYATANGVRLSISFNGTSGQACYLDEVFVTTNGLLQRAPLTLATSPTGASTTTSTWSDNAST